MKKVIFIEGKREAYSVDQIDEYIGTSTVGELISILEKFDKDIPVYLNNDNGYTYGSITEWTIKENEVETEDDYVEDEVDTED